ncbi:MAG: bifunctional folylpolyglutamate synthase/dihydrofolate synthase [Pirellula sp.]|nr:bifunctional folylpolyglutamate synthase/dihydrofolate synthase [Pirellula sp.]
MTVSVEEARRGAIDFLLNRIDYERSTAVPYEERQYRLDRMRDLLARLGRPDRKLTIVHVAGTKGKGSTSALVAAALTECGHSCGLFTSPHLERLEERFVVDGKLCEPLELAALVDRIRPIVLTMDEELAKATPPDLGPTYFELTTAIALLHFVERGATHAVLEVGMGGRLDSTNVCQSAVSVITSISLDHTKELGDTLAKIAWEKAGIIKPGVPVVSGVVDDEPRAVVRRIAAERGCRLTELGRDFEFTYRPARDLQAAPATGRLDIRSGAEQHALADVALNLPGRHQAANAAVAWAVLEELRRGGLALPEAGVRRAWENVQWPGRVEVVGRRPCIVFDAAHNVASVRALVETLRESFTARRRILVFATTLEKDVDGMLRELLPEFDEVVLTRYRNNARAVPVEDLARLAAAQRVEGRTSHWQVASEPATAWQAVHALKPSVDDLICVTGSFFLLGQMRKVIEAAPLSGR